MTVTRRMHRAREGDVERGIPMTRQQPQYREQRAARQANLAKGVHILILRHTFCSHLVMRGAPAKAIQ